jgi:hypothetical protein
MKKKVKRKLSRIREIEYAERLDTVRQLVALGCYASSIRSECYYRWGLSVAKANGLIAKAKLQLREDTDKSVKEHRKDAVNFLNELMRKPDVAEKVKLKAQEQKSRILGLDEAISIRTEVELTADTNRKLAIDIEKNNPELIKAILKASRDSRKT